MITTRRSSVTFGADPVAQSVRSTISSSARLASTVPAESCCGNGLDLVHLYPAIFAVEPRPAHKAPYVAAMSGALSATFAAVAVMAAVFHR